MSYSLLTSAMTAAVAALESGDYATALTKARVARGYLATIPSVKNSGSEMTWSYSAIDGFIRDCKEAQREALMTSTNGVMQIQKVQYQRPDSDSGDC